jgi:hypothetical protein
VTRAPEPVLPAESRAPVSPEAQAAARLTLVRPAALREARLGDPAGAPAGVVPAERQERLTRAQAAVSPEARAAARLMAVRPAVVREARVANRAGARAVVVLEEQGELPTQAQAAAPIHSLAGRIG